MVPIQVELNQLNDVFHFRNAMLEDIQQDGEEDSLDLIINGLRWRSDYPIEDKPDGKRFCLHFEKAQADIPELKPIEHDLILSGRFTPEKDFRLVVLTAGETEYYPLTIQAKKVTITAAC